MAAMVSIERRWGSVGQRLRADLRGVGIVWQRELIRFLRTRVRIATGLIQPVLFLFVLGVGLSPLVGSAGNVDFTKFVFPAWWR